MAIHILPDEVASQIAAGEVVERPASVVKELFENALDAGAGQIDIHIEQSGKRLIEISDDGAGIPADELSLAVMRHATSKMRSADDLFAIRTLGFRGEALASVASVSRFSLTSRPTSQAVGAVLKVDGGKGAKMEPVGAPEGTVVRVEDLFYNVPARLKFLKQDATERNAINALVTRYAIAYPSTRVRLTHDGQLVLQTSGKGDRREVLANLYGVELAKNMLEVTFQEDGMRLSGFISPVAVTRSNRKEITFFVNGRWVQDAALSRALLNGYQNLIMVGRYPLAMLFLDVPPEEVDVNVHPAKAEVRFRSSDKVFGTVQRAVRRGLLAYSPVPNLSIGGWGGERAAYFPARSNQSALDWNQVGMEQEPVEAGSSDSTEVSPALFQAGASAPESGPQPRLPAANMPILRLVGQVGATYLVAEGPDGLYLIDQHAAHERVLFEKFMQRRASGLAAQRLLEAETIQLSPAQASLMESQLELLQQLGFEIEPFGPNLFRVSAIPALLAGSDVQSAVRVVVEDFEEDETPLQAEVEAKLVARICKRSAVKGGQTLSTAEQQTLLRDLEACVNPRTCPHGRPTMIHLSVDLLEKQFGRKGSL
ncbi:MAG: DNA mismatch repair endonuclease MutL [Chloroflexi bacterium]|nr:DNA mismatch repair endonuclease MutL [Chloroflexota bacterium]